MLYSKTARSKSLIRSAVEWLRGILKPFREPSLFIAAGIAINGRGADARVAHPPLHKIQWHQGLKRSGPRRPCL